jgi:putative endonuclease
VLYVGVTGDLALRVAQHKVGRSPSFTRRHNARRLVYFEATTDIRVAIEREKQLKGWTRARKVALIEAANPGWKDLSEGL